MSFRYDDKGLFFFLNEIWEKKNMLCDLSIPVAKISKGCLTNVSKRNRELCDRLAVLFNAELETTSARIFGVINQRAPHGS